VNTAGSLRVVGLGLRAVAHLTHETADHIAKSERFFYLAGDALMAGWLRQLQPAGVSLAGCYAEGRPRAKSYEEMVRRVMPELRDGRRVVVAFYGHPGVAATPAHAMIRQARAEGLDARMLPAVSADGCLFADLGVDPLIPGLQSFEAWRFVAERVRLDTRFSLVLWQIGLIYQRSVSFDGISDPRGLRDLGRRLRRSYPADHEVVLYEAATLPICEPRMERLPLSRLATAHVTPATTLYVPPRATVERRRPRVPKRPTHRRLR
jgi:uncharacterized protein YabN with tetrapyrrole methylase and pyrophosphatase domain